jgi:hypothetical protein
MPEIISTGLPNVMHEAIDNEVVVVNLDNGSYYSFDGVGGRVWEWLDGEGESLEGLIARATVSFTGVPNEIAAAVERFVNELKEEKLVSITTGDTDPSRDRMEPPDYKLPFQKPLLQKYTDMEALLLVDPIHEVDEEEGWPKQK